MPTDWNAVALQDKKAGTDWEAQAQAPEPDEGHPAARRLHESQQQLAGSMLPGLTYEDLIHPNVGRITSHVLPAAVQMMMRPGAAAAISPQGAAVNQGGAFWNSLTNPTVGTAAEKLTNALGDPKKLSPERIKELWAINPILGAAAETLWNQRWAGKKGQAGRDVGDVATMLAAPPGIGEESTAAKAVSREEAIARAIARMAKPENEEQAAHQAAAIRLARDKKVRLTQGRLTGGRELQDEEHDKANDPYKGPPLQRADRRMVEDVNRAAYNDALSHIGESMSEDAAVGHVALKKTKQAFNAFYDKWLGKATVLNDETLDKQLSELIERVPLSMKDEFRQIINNSITDVFKSRKSMTGKEFKVVQKDLRKRGQKWVQGTGPVHDTGQAILDAETILREALNRGSPPEVAKALAEADIGYNKYSRIKDAVVAGIGRRGVFTPIDLLRSLKAARGRAGETVRTAVASGDAFLQELAGDAEQVIGSEAYGKDAKEKEGGWEQIAKDAAAGLGIGIPATLAIKHGLLPEFASDTIVAPVGAALGALVGGRAGKSIRTRLSAKEEAALLRQMGMPPDPYLKRALRSPKLAPKEVTQGLGLSTAGAQGRAQQEAQERRQREIAEQAEGL